MANVPWSPRDARPSKIVWEGDIVPPVTSYAFAAKRTPLYSQNQIPPSTNRTGSMVVNRRNRRNGMRYFYSYGGTVMPLPKVPTPGAGGVRNSTFQSILVHLFDWSDNLGLFAAGYPRNLGYSTRVPQPETNASGGPTSALMDARPLFPRVQVIRRYTVNPPTYQTKSSNS